MLCLLLLRCLYCPVDAWFSTFSFLFLMLVMEAYYSTSDMAGMIFCYGLANASSLCPLCGTNPCRRVPSDMVFGRLFHCFKEIGSLTPTRWPMESLGQFAHLRWRSMCYITVVIGSSRMSDSPSCLGSTTRAHPGTKARRPP